jgi:hypothetical protein
MTEELRPKKRTIARHVTIWHTFMFSMLSGIQSLAAFVTSQALWMPIEAKTLLTFS